MCFMTIASKSGFTFRAAWMSVGYKSPLMARRGTVNLRADAFTS
jgi:hypothetical protein